MIERTQALAERDATLHLCCAVTPRGPIAVENFCLPEWNIDSEVYEIADAG